jgi:hypothetical protein
MADARSRPSDTLARQAAQIEPTASDFARRIEAQGRRVRARGEHYRAQCPLCDSRGLSLSVRTGDRGKPIAYCHRCEGTQDELRAALFNVVTLPSSRRSSPWPPRTPHYLGDTNSPVAPLDVAIPKRCGSVARAIVADLAGLFGARRAAGDYRAHPYAVTWAAQRIGVSERSVKRALRWLVGNDVLVPRLLWREHDDRRTPTRAYRFSESALRRDLDGPAVTRPVERPRRVPVPGRVEPLPERDHVAGVPRAELGRPLVGSVAGQRRLAAMRNRAEHPGVVGEGIGHVGDSPIDCGESRIGGIS